MASIAQQIEDFAKEMLLSVTNTNETERMETEVSNKVPLVISVCGSLLKLGINHIL